MTSIPGQVRMPIATDSTSILEVAVEGDQGCGESVAASEALAPYLDRLWLWWCLWLVFVEWHEHDEASCTVVWVWVCTCASM